MFLLLLLFACPSETSVQSAIDDAKSCTTADECVDVGSQCPFGCNIVVNKTEEAHIRELLDQYAKSQVGSACMYDCIMVGPIVCEAGQCGRGPADTGM